MRRTFRFAIVGVALVLTQELHSQTEQTKTSTFTSLTELVLIPTVVNDSSGSHISGLKKEAFALKQDGKSQPIAVFEEVETDSARLRRSEGEQAIFSNIELGGVGGYHRVTIIVFDLVNTPPADQSNARAELLKFLSEIAESGEPMSLLALTRGGLVVLHDFTEDPKILASALAKAQSHAPLVDEPIVVPLHPFDGPHAKQLTELIRGELKAEAQLVSMQNRTAASLTVDTFRQLAKAFAGFPGRKSLIWVSSGFPLSLSPGGGPPICEPACPQNKSDQMHSAYDQLWRTMNDAQMAIYSVDLRSGSASGLTVSTGGVRPADRGDPEFDVEAKARETRLDTDSTLRSFAENTGGKAFLGGNDLIGSFRQAVRDGSSYYMLGYYISRNRTKPGWHNVSVKVDTKGARVRYRIGFLLSKDTSLDSAQQDIQLALASPLDYTGLPISATWSGAEPGKTPEKKRVRFELVMPADFASVDESDQNHMVVDIAAVARNPQGGVFAEVSQRIDVHLPAEGLEQIRHNGLTYRNGLQLPPGQYMVRFVVRDTLGNRMGSVAAPVTVAQE